MQEAGKHDLFRYALLFRKARALQEMRGRRKTQIEEVGQRRLLRHLLQAMHLEADVIELRLLVAVLVHEQPADTAPIATTVHLILKVGDGWIFFVFPGGDRSV